MNGVARTTMSPEEEAVQQLSIARDLPTLERYFYLKTGVCIGRPVRQLPDRRDPSGDVGEAYQEARKLKEEGWFWVRGRISGGIPEENRPLESLCGLTDLEGKLKVWPSVLKALGGSPLKEDYIVARWDPATRTIELKSPNNPSFWVNLGVPSE